MLTIKQYFKPLGLLLAGLIFGIVATLLFQRFSGPKQVVNVSGQGLVEATADKADINVSIQNTSTNQNQAEKDNKKEVQDLKSKLMKLGIPESRITVSNYNILPYSQSLAPGQPSPLFEVNSFTATSNLNITLDTLSGIDKIYALVNQSPNAKIGYTNYSLKSTVPYEAKAREKALQDVRNQVETIAKVNKLRVGKLVSISNTFTPVPIYKEAAAVPDRIQSSEAGTVGTTSISYGEKTIQITASYNAQYELY